jgi:hypothetical protein
VKTSLSTSTPRLLTWEARRKAAILIMSARTDGERVDLSRCLYPKFIGQ